MAHSCRKAPARSAESNIHCVQLEREECVDHDLDAILEGALEPWLFGRGAFQLTSCCMFCRHRSLGRNFNRIARGDLGC